MTYQDGSPHQQYGTLTTQVPHEGKEPEHSGKGQLLLEWTSPARPFRKRTKEYYTTLGALVFLLVVILFLIQEWMAIGAILAVVFVAYVLSTVPPETIHHRITTFGVENAGRRYSWIELYEFWFEEKDEVAMLTMQTRIPFPPRIHILLGEVKKEEVKAVLERYLPFRPEPVRTFTDRAAGWLSRKIPLESASS